MSNKIIETIETIDEYSDEYSDDVICRKRGNVKTEVITQTIELCKKCINLTDNKKALTEYKNNHYMCHHVVLEQYKKDNSELNTIMFDNHENMDAETFQNMFKNSKILEKKIKITKNMIQICKLEGLYK